MGVYEEAQVVQNGMHWQQHDRYLGSAYDPSRDLSPNLPVHSCDSSSMGDVDQSLSNNSSLCSSNTSGSNCSTPSSSNNNTSNNSSCNVHPCIHHRGYDIGPHQRPTPPCNNCGGAGPGGDASCARRAYDRGGVGPPPSGSFPDCDGGATYPPHPPPLLHPKIEQCPATPPSPPATTDDAVVCAGCGQRISDRFYLLAVDRRWHAACLQCCQCRQTLDGEVTCFSRDGNIYCKKDYHRLFGMKRCARCQAAILSSELVMRARDLVFHVHCFTCAVCNSPLTKGDHFGMRNGAVFCRLHYETALTEHTHPMGPNPPASKQATFPGGGAGTYLPPYPSPEFHPHHPHHHHHHHHHHPLPSPLPIQTPTPVGSEGIPPTSKVSYFNGATTGTTRQKGRPRKRKPKDLEAMTASLDLNADYLDIPFGRSGPGTPGMPGSNGQRTKRMRTSFKHHQLRTMKSYFAINHNPDAKDLKQLSQKTGLPKRVLQVWFQNARAKWRRMVLKQEGKSGGPGDKCSGPESAGSLADLEGYQQHGGSSGDYRSQGLGSPPFLLGGSSPSALECS